MPLEDLSLSIDLSWLQDLPTGIEMIGKKQILAKM